MQYDKERVNLGEPFTLDRAVVNITFRCTLRCKLCVSGSPYYETPPHYSLKTVEKTIERFFAVVDHVRWFEFSGGEPLLHKDLPKMVEKAIKYREQFDKLLIITNGTLLPSESLKTVLLKYHDVLLFQISHYGDASVHADELAEWLRNNQIEVEVKKYFGENQHFGGWVDYGPIEKYGRTEEELSKIFENCGATKMNGNMTIHNGKLHWCVPSARGMTVLGVIPQCSSDYIDLLDDSMTVGQQRSKFRELYAKSHITACDYCSGDFGSETAKRYPAGEQLSRSK